MSDQFYFAVVTGVVYGMITAVPLLAIWGALRVLTRVVAKSKLSLDDYLALELKD